MKFTQITPRYAVAPQIDPADAERIREAGFTDVVCNRPDDEVPNELGTDAMQEALAAAGLRFHVNPVRSGALTEAEVARQAGILEEAEGPVLAYCRSGTRSTVVWALGEDAMSPEEIVSTAGRAGYDLSGLLPQLARR